MSAARSDDGIAAAVHEPRSDGEDARARLERIPRLDGDVGEFPDAPAGDQDALRLGDAGRVGNDREVRRLRIGQGCGGRGDPNLAQDIVPRRGRGVEDPSRAHAVSRRRSPPITTATRSLRNSQSPAVPSAMSPPNGGGPERSVSSTKGGARATTSALGPSGEGARAHPAASVSAASTISRRPRRRERRGRSMPIMLPAARASRHPCAQKKKRGSVARPPLAERDPPRVYCSRNRSRRVRTCPPVSRR